MTSRRLVGGPAVIRWHRADPYREIGFSTRLPGWPSLGSARKAQIGVLIIVGILWCLERSR
jgi:hypothetical protein